MKKLLLISVMLFGAYSSKTQAQTQDTIIGLTAITGTLDDTVANLGIPENLPPISTVSLRTVGGTSSITSTNGQITGDYSCTATNWDNGMNTKYWEIGFKTGGSSNLLLSSKQRAGGNNGGGPKDWKAQYKIDTNGTWTDIPGATAIITANDWTTGVLTDVSLPAACDMISQTIFIRWIMTTNDNTSGTAVQSAAVSKLDEIFVKADIGVGMATIFERKAFSVYPNPSHGKVNIHFSEKADAISVFDFLGNLILSQTVNDSDVTLDMTQYPKGMYFLNATESSTGINYSQKIILQ
ncbi:MAG: T9SS type A sorting domain-containing protein [Bacteroidota bacterium]